MKTNPSDVFLLQKIDSINHGNGDTGASRDDVMSGIDPVHESDVIKSLAQLINAGVIEEVSAAVYKVTGEAENTSDEVRHYVRHRTIPN